MKTNPEVLIVFYTRHRNTAKMAEAITEGSRKEGANTKLARIADDVSIEIIKKDPTWLQKHKELEEQYPHLIHLQLLMRWENQTQ